MTLLKFFSVLANSVSSLALSRLIQPSRALMPSLLARYNICLLDALDQRPRILPYQYFRSFKVRLRLFGDFCKYPLTSYTQVLQAFIEHEFKTLPGAISVDRGRYLILGLRTNKFLNEENWSRFIAPGATIATPMLVRSHLGQYLGPSEERCPEPSCSGTWKRSETLSWVTWYVQDRTSSEILRT